MVSIGPTITGAHSPDEQVHIKSVGQYWQLLTAILKAIPEKRNRLIQLSGGIIIPPFLYVIQNPSSNCRSLRIPQCYMQPHQPYAAPFPAALPGQFRRFQQIRFIQHLMDMFLCGLLKVRKLQFNALTSDPQIR